MSLVECSHCLETVFRTDESHFKVEGVNLEEGAMCFLLCEACGRKILQRKLAKLSGE